MSGNIKAPKCSLCGEPMPPGEEMFRYHGYSGPCHQRPTSEFKASNTESKFEEALVQAHRAWYGLQKTGSGHMMAFPQVDAAEANLRSAHRAAVEEAVEQQHHAYLERIDVGEQRIAELERENERLRSALASWKAYERDHKETL